MGKTFKKNGRWKKDGRDQNFHKSKKFKELKDGYIHPKTHLPQVDSEPIDTTDDNS
jgi:hypothetical protein